MRIVAALVAFIVGYILGVVMVRVIVETAKLTLVDLDWLGWLRLMPFMAGIGCSVAVVLLMFNGKRPFMKR
jgi:hypothetical protein